MGLHAEWLHWGADNQYLAYVAKPERAQEPLPAIVVLQEVWGVDQHIQDVTRRFAQAGYVAVAPDLYACAAGGERPEDMRDERIQEVKTFLDSLPPTAWGDQQQRDEALDRLPADHGQRVRDTLGKVFGGMGNPAFLESILATTTFLRETYGATRGQKTGSVGFCMGGALSAQLATRDHALSAAAIFYGNAPADDLIPGIACPVIGFYGELDPRITDAVPGFAEKMEQAGKSFSSHVYTGAHHAFFNDTRRSYHAGAARDAFARVLTFFNDTLSS